MNTKLLHEVAHNSYNNTISFPEVVQALSKEGVESYHVDLVRNEYRYYLPNGESHVEKLEHTYPQAAMKFSADAVEANVRAIQSGHISYQEFIKKIMEAGCVYYITYLSGRKVVYFGRDGAKHVEHFPN